ncbi:hypothetical protein QU487_07340 [Crenobacter sp. SG2305]|uniref:hypothetical protein n=1 Tax=Crenobacter oryzisoli TaxID=3056844 RepID=UPI0025AA3A67|nr:hypothetical protein [Crenobacter sp. SG2305]MDN0082567.1 hypothetical protein [Crenobacter sp. SG2305]
MDAFFHSGTLVFGGGHVVLPLLLATIYHPIWASAIHQPGDFGLALVALAALIFWRLPPWLVVISCG